MQVHDTNGRRKVAPRLTRRGVLLTLGVGALALAETAPSISARARRSDPLREIVAEADTLGLPILKDDLPRTKPVTYFGTFEGRRYLAYDTAVPLEIVLPQLRAGLEEWKEWRAEPWSEAEIKAAIRSYRGDDPRLQAASAALKTIEGTARPGELEETLRFLPESDRQAAREIIAKAVK